MDELLRMFKALADPTRLRIVRMLAIKPLCVCEVMNVLGMAQSTTSKHLKILQQAGLVEEIPGGVWTVYRLPKVKRGGACSALVKRILEAAPTEEMKRDHSAAKSADRNRICRSGLERRLKNQKG